MTHVPGHSDFADIANIDVSQSLVPQQEVLGGYALPPRAAGPPLAGELPTPVGWEPYYAGEEQGFLANMTDENLVELQQQLVAVGLASRPIYGQIDDQTVRGFASILAMTNRAGTTGPKETRWLSTLNEIATSADAQQQVEEFEPGPYLAPDYASLAQEVKSMFRDRLGRDPDQSEMALLTAEWQGWDRRAFDAQTEAQRQSFEQQTTPGVQGGGTVQSVDPVARFQQRFDELYANELDFVEDKEDAQVSRAVVQGGVDTLSQMSEGG